MPVGTRLFLRLKTAVSTSFSHLHQPVEADVVRKVDCGSMVVIPVGTLAQGAIEKLIPSSNPSDRAKLLLRFGQLKFPSGKTVSLDSRVVEVENAREKVLPNGSIQGVLASELPVSLLHRALARLGALTAGESGSFGQLEKTYFGNPDTSISYPAGTDLDIALSQPLEITGSFPPLFSNELPPALGRAVEQVLKDAPRRVAGKDGAPGDPLNLVLIGNAATIQQVFQKAGWTAPEKETGSSIWQAIQAAVKNKGYGTAPVSTLYLYGRPEDLAFEKMLNTFEKRHHLRLWRSPATLPDGREIWLGAATHDNGIDIHPGVISHAINPDLDSERDKVAADLGLTGMVAAEAFVTPPHPLSQGLTATGAPWKTDGRLVVLDLQGR